MFFDAFVGKSGTVIFKAKFADFLGKRYASRTNHSPRGTSVQEKENVAINYSFDNLGSPVKIRGQLNS
jgi:hypothetical protein